MVLVSVSASRVVVGEAVTVEVDSAELVMLGSTVGYFVLIFIEFNEAYKNNSLVLMDQKCCSQCQWAGIKNSNCKLRLFTRFKNQ